MSGIKKRLCKALRWGLFLALQAALFWSADRLQWMAGGVSLRFDAALTARQTEKALEYASKSDTGYALSFWTEQPGVSIEANGRMATARLLTVCGDAARLTPQKLLWGAPPAAPGGCAVSDALAWRLWGALDVAGMELTAGDACYAVRGLFHDESLCLIVQSAPDGTGYENVEVYRMGSGTRGVTASEGAASQNIAPGVEVSHTVPSQNTAPNIDTALSFARAAGLGIPAHAVNGSTLAALAFLLCWLPPMLCAESLLRRFVRVLPARAKRVFRGAGLLLFALCLPRLLAALPASWLPTRWSDFAFWQSLLQTGAARIEAWFALPPQSVDVTAKWLLLRYGALCLGGCIAGRWALTKTKEARLLPGTRTGEDGRTLSLSPARPRTARSSGTPSARFQNTI